MADYGPLKAEISGCRYCDFHAVYWIDFGVAILTNLILYGSRSVKLPVDSFTVQA